MSKVTDFEAAGTIGAIEHLLKTNGICIALTVAKAVAVGDAVTNTCYAEWFLSGFTFFGGNCWDCN